jgi:hypothetical protein
MFGGLVARRSAVVFSPSISLPVFVRKTTRRRSDAAVGVQVGVPTLGEARDRRSRTPSRQRLSCHDDNRPPSSLSPSPKPDHSMDLSQDPLLSFALLFAPSRLRVRSIRSCCPSSISSRGISQLLLSPEGGDTHRRNRRFASNFSAVTCSNHSREQKTCHPRGWLVTTAKGGDG